MNIRLAVAAVAASAALLGGAVTAPDAHAAPDARSQSIKNALDAIDPQPHDAASVIDGIQAANALLTKLGITPFTPTIGACTDFTFPLAVGGAMPGPNTPLLGDMTILGVDLNTVKAGEVLYGFVPVGVFNDSGDKSGMQVAWFNVNTFQGGLGAPMDGLADTLVNATVKRVKELSPIPVLDSAVQAAVKTTLKPVLDILPSNGVRGGLVDTGAGTVLSAIYGSVRKGDATCYFFPSLGIATVK